MYVPFLFILLQMSGKILFPVYFWSIGPHFLFISGNIMLSDGWVGYRVGRMLPEPDTQTGPYINSIALLKILSNSRSWPWPTWSLTWLTWSPQMAKPSLELPRHQPDHTSLDLGKIWAKVETIVKQATPPLNFSKVESWNSYSLTAHNFREELDWHWNQFSP